MPGFFLLTRSPLGLNSLEIFLISSVLKNYNSLGELDYESIKKFFETDFVIKINALSERRLDLSTVIFKFSGRIKFHASIYRPLVKNQSKQFFFH